MALDSFEPLDDDFNPYAAPKARAEPARIGGDLTEAEEIRRTYLNHEASVRSIGSLTLIGAVLNSIQVVVYLLIAIGSMAPINQGAQNFDPETQRTMAWVNFALNLGTATLGFFLGIGLRRLQVWARWTSLVFAVIGLIFVLLASLAVMALVSPIPGLIFLVVGGGINGYIVSLLASSKTTYICTPEYREIIALTPHIKYRMSLLVKILLVIVVLFILLALVVPAMMMAFRR
ncbi:MAG TPA: hypothetical protein VG406_00895 [Isosphaeraceae bacterium]|jgi:hypothetical protein|nr:hypothetical protein [Isosphaeraceae bacterium]